MMFEVTDRTKEEPIFINVKVRNPAKEPGSYVTYEITIETNDPSFSYTNSTTRRRYSDFRTLKTLLAKQLPYNKLPFFPPKEPFKSSFDQDLVQKRQVALQDFLKKLLEDQLFLSCKVLHLFLQSSLTMTEIKNIVDGKTSIEVQPPSSNFSDSLTTNNGRTNEAIFENGVTNACAVLQPSSVTNVNSIDSKRVSFCDQVTVAEVHTT